ncbi:hypothetical protein [Streptomyces cupreus]|uniref:Uncharacterized protein n=1 Tax=Streptomyces cupreus TaxID=2759956 RepID=A0A7X1J1K7_9ACTN|nr:hypothetical protein [Streptomyces cupreus]MBC2902446.1 hypothetical protein [Streptomyces cupreus]
MTHSPTEDDHLPIYEDLVRERGDAVAEAQTAATHMQHQAAELLNSPDAHGPDRPRPAHHPDGPFTRP